MVRRLTGGLVAVLAVAGLASASQLATTPAVGAPVASAVGSVFPGEVSAGGTTRFCGAGFAAGSPVEVRVGGTTATSTTAAGDGRFCVNLQARPAASGSPRLVAVGRTPSGAGLNVIGGVAITQSVALPQAPRSAVGPLVSDSRPVVLEAWGALGVLAVVMGGVSISAQRRRNPVPARVIAAAE
jgi:hypothetical protein